MTRRRLLWITCLSATALEPACVRLGYGVIETDGADWGGIGNVPLGTWFCLTYSIQVGDAGQVTADIDGTTLIDVPVDTYDADYTNVFFGAWVNRGMTGLEVNIDDVVIGTQPIGCN